MAERTCVICASTFTANGGTAVTCGNPDCQRLRRNERMREFFRRHKEATGEAYTQRYREKRNAHARATNARYRKFREEEQSCAYCTALFLPRLDQAYRFCSRACAIRARTSPVSKIRVLDCAEHCGRLGTVRGATWWWRCDDCSPEPVPANPRFQAGRCRRCDAYFVMSYNNRPCHYCSDGCQRRDHKSTRRARKRDAFVAPVYRTQIFERDGWRCQICKKKVRRTAVVPHPLAPVLDHITPLADGGTHEPANVQCAHYLCNSAKSHGAANDQLRLIG